MEQSFAAHGQQSIIPVVLRHDWPYVAVTALDCNL
jgi:hypothetical protein